MKYASQVTQLLAFLLDNNFISLSSYRNKLRKMVSKHNFVLKSMLSIQTQSPFCKDFVPINANISLSRSILGYSEQQTLLFLQFQTISISDRLKLELQYTRVKVDEIFCGEIYFCISFHFHFISYQLRSIVFKSNFVHQPILSIQRARPLCKDFVAINAEN